MILENIAVLIPALNPNRKLVELIKKLNQAGLVNVVVIDDGSESSTQAVFDELQMYQATVYHHKYNQGKGAALRTGIEYIQKNQPHSIGIVTADADGQHAPNDILKVANALATVNTIVLGTRDLSRPGVPLSSKLGNLFSAIYYKLKTGRLLKDTQTGLRGIPAKYFDFARHIAGDRYDYEMRFLEQMSEKNIIYRTVDIETIYEKDRVTHFSAVRDSYLIYKTFFTNVLSSLLSAVVDISSFMLLAYAGNNIFFGNRDSQSAFGDFQLFVEQGLGV